MTGHGPESSRPGPGPLSGMRVAVTRPRERARELVTPLEAAGAATRCFPLIRIVGPADERPLRDAAARADAFDWLLFTSATAVDALALARTDGRLPPGPPPQCAAIGAATAEAIAAAGRTADLVASTSTAEGLLAALTARGPLRGTRFLWPRAGGARPVLAEGLRAAGALVEAPEAYSAAPDPPQAAGLARALRDGLIDVVTFTSPSAIRSFLEGGGTIPRDVRIAAIGPITAAAARAAGLHPDIMASTASAEGLVAALIEWAGRRS